MEEVKNSLEEVISCIKDSNEYKTCMHLKKQMSENMEICDKIESVKKIQKQIVKNDKDLELQKKLELLISELNEIPLYVVYNQNLELVNNMIDYVRDSLNDYFESIFEKDTSN